MILLPCLTLQCQWYQFQSDKILTHLPRQCISSFVQHMGTLFPAYKWSFVVHFWLRENFQNFYMIDIIFWFMIWSVQCCLSTHKVYGMIFCSNAAMQDNWCMEPLGFRFRTVPKLHLLYFRKAEVGTIALWVVMRSRFPPTPKKLGLQALAVPRFVVPTEIFLFATYSYMRIYMTIPAKILLRTV